MARGKRKNNPTNGLKEEIDSNVRIYVRLFRFHSTAYGSHSDEIQRQCSRKWEIIATPIIRD